MKKPKTEAQFRTFIYRKLLAIEGKLNRAQDITHNALEVDLKQLYHVIYDEWPYAREVRAENERLRRKGKTRVKK